MRPVNARRDPQFKRAASAHVWSSWTATAMAPMPSSTKTMPAAMNWPLTGLLSDPDRADGHP